MSVSRRTAAHDESTSPTPRVRRGHVALAAALYLGVALWVWRAVLPEPRTAMPYPTSLAALGGSWLELSQNDQKLTTALLTANARRIVTAPWRLFDNGQCYPLRNASALGEHMFGAGLRAVVPYALTGDPVLTTNVEAVSQVWLAGMAMYLAVAYWTGSPEAALVAGLVFALQPTRLTNGAIHPYVEANAWTVIALVAAHRLFTRGAWTDAALLAGAIGLQMLESFYTVLGLAILGGVWGLYLVVRFRRRVLTLAPKLLAVVAVVTLVACALFRPYLHMRAAWGGTMARQGTILYGLRDFGIGGAAYPGTIAVVLAAIALIDRLRRARPVDGYDPRLPLLAGGLLALAASVRGIPLPFGASIPSLYELAARVVPGLDAIRAGGAIGRIASLVAAVLAGYGIAVVVERRSARTRALVAAVAIAAVLAAVLVPAIAAREFGAPLTMAAHEVRPPAPLVALYDRLPDGPVLDVPFQYGRGGILQYMPHYVFLAAYHHHPVGACYDSFIVQVQEDLVALASGLPSRTASDALAALGFRSLVVHDEMLLGPRRDRRLAQLTGAAALAHPPDFEATHLRLLAHAEGHTAYALEDNAATTTRYAALASDDDPASNGPTVRPPRADVLLVIRNSASETFHHPPPLEPTSMRARWYAPGGELLYEDGARLMLPLALAPRASIVRKIALTVPPTPGDYRLTLAPEDAPDTVVARQRVRVAAPAG